MHDTEPIPEVSDLIRSLPPYRPRPADPERVRGTLMELLGIETLPDAPSATWDDPVIEDDVRVTRGRFRNVLDETAPIAVCRPSPAHGAPPPTGRPAILCLPGSRGDAEVLIHHRLHRKDPERGPLYGWARELARRGFMTLSLSARGCGPRDDRQRWIREANCMRPRGRSQMGYVVLEALQAIALLADLDGVDTSRVGVTGFSAGGQSTWYATALDPSIKAAAPLCGGLGTMEAMIREGDLVRHGPDYFVPGFLRHFDHPDIVTACIAPRPLMLLAPTRDEDMPSSGVDDLLAAVQPAYADAGAEDRLEVHRPDLHHVFLIEHLEWVAGFFARHLVGRHL